MPMGGVADDEAKIFVGALSGQTTGESLRQYFSKYGEVLDTVVMMDKVTLRSRGFGFVTFRDTGTVQVVLNNRTHILDDKKIDPKPCTPKAIQLAKRNAEIEHVQTHKIFVGGVARDASEQDVQQYFQSFGAVTEVSLVLDDGQQRHKGFGFVTFEEAYSVDAALAMHFHDIKGRKVETKRAQPRDKMLTGTVRPPHKEPKSSLNGGGGGYGYNAHSPPVQPSNGGGYGYNEPSPPVQPSNGVGCYGNGAPLQASCGGWMPPTGTSTPMMNNAYGYNYYGYTYGPAPTRAGGGMPGNIPSVDQPNQWHTSYGPTKSGPYVDPGFRKPGGPGFHPYKR